VKFLGFVPDEDLGGLLSGSIGFVFPSFSEGFGLPGLEAMSSGTLLIASDIPVFREVYQKHAIYFDPKDVGSIEKALEESIKLSQSEREKIIQDAKEFVNIYSWDKMAQETLNIYAESGDSIRQSQ
jgi:glycosyltransferase involved in cell wall biosynthesis